FDDAPAASRIRIVVLYGLLLSFNGFAWTWAIATFGSRPLLLSTAFLAYVLGLRHAVDADHIATIDNIVRKLMQEGKQPLSVGLFFALGHSLSVILVAVTVAATALAVQERFNKFNELGGIVGTGVSAFFLLSIGAVNLFVLRAVWRNFLRVRRGEDVGEQELDLLLSGRGIIVRILRPLFRIV